MLRMACEDGQIPWLGIGVGLVLGKKDEVVWHLKEESVASVYVFHAEDLPYRHVTLYMSCFTHYLLLSLAYSHTHIAAKGFSEGFGQCNDCESLM